MAWKTYFDISLLHSGQPSSTALPSPPSPSLSPLAPIVVSFLPLLSSLRGISELFPHEKTFPRAKTAITAASSHPRPARHPRPPVLRRRSSPRRRSPPWHGPPSPRLLSVEQIAAPSPKERRDQRPPSRLQIVTAERSRRERANFAHLILRRIPEFLGVSLGSRLPILNG